MIQLSIVVDDISLVLATYDQIKVYKATASDGPFTELTDVNTRIDIIPETTIYEFEDPAGTNANWYRTTYYNSTTFAESAQSTSRQGGTETEKIGYSFKNYAPPSGEWGKLITADDMRYTYLWGVDVTASDVAETDFEDVQFDFFIEEAVADFEKALTIDIRKKVYKTNPEDVLIRGPEWREGVDYTDYEDPYAFDPKEWQNFGFLKLRHYPLISVERAVMKNVVSGDLIDLKERGWLRIGSRNTGRLSFHPTSGLAYGPFAVGVLPWRTMVGRFPQGYEIDYTTGYESSDFVPKDLRSIIGKWACIKCLASIGDGLLAGFSSQSVSLDGLSESFSSTQSATSAYFGARIKQYQDEVKDWLIRNRNKYGAIPMSFVGY